MMSLTDPTSLCENCGQIQPCLCGLGPRLKDVGPGPAAARVSECPVCGPSSQVPHQMLGVGDRITFRCCQRSYQLAEVTTKSGDTGLFLAKLSDGSTYRVNDPRGIRRRQAMDVLRRMIEDDDRRLLRVESPTPVQLLGDPYTLHLEDAPGPDGAVTIELAHRYNKVLVVVDGHPRDREPDTPACRWCAGDGLDPDLSNRVRAVVECTYGWSLSPSVFPRPESGFELFCVPGITKERPFNEWINRMLMAARDPHEVLVQVGRSAAQMRCPRCFGSGKPNAKREVAHAAQHRD